ncbi:MAG: RNA-binding S4 domain-containing protein [Lachnospirales bacterium]
MNTMDIEIKTEYIKLGQLLKLATILTNGSDFKFFIENNLITRNNEKLIERGKKIYKGDTIIINTETTINVL